MFDDLDPVVKQHPTNTNVFVGAPGAGMTRVVCAWAIPPPLVTPWLDHGVQVNKKALRAFARRHNDLDPGVKQHPTNTFVFVGAPRTGMTGVLLVTRVSPSPRVWVTAPPPGAMVCNYYSE